MGLVFADRGVAVRDARGRDEDCGAGREFNNYAELSQDEVATMCRIKRAVAVNRAPAGCTITMVVVLKADGVRSKVEGCTGENAVVPVVVQLRIVREQSVEFCSVVAIYFWSEEGEHTCREINDEPRTRAREKDRLTACEASDALNSSVSF